MKVLVIGLFPTLGGIESYIYNLVKKIDRNRYYMDFWVIGDNGKTFYEDEINSLYDDGRNHFYYLPNLKKKFIASIVTIFHLIKKNKYDAIYLNSDTSAKVLYCLYQKAVQQTPIIMHCHSSGGENRNHLLFQPLMNRLCKYKVACSEKAAQWMFGNKYLDNAIIIPNGVDTKRFRFNKEFRDKIRKMLKINEREVLIGHVGRFTSVKNHAFIIELIASLPDQYKAVFIGDGELRDEIIGLINEMNLTNRVILLSARNNIEEYYSAMDFFVMPSFYEGLPIVAVEAQCSGLPCILSDNISRMSSVSDNCIFLPLSIERWKTVLEERKKQRYDGETLVTKANLSIDVQADKICNIFDRCVKLK